jgi:hypothetical protein
LLALLQAHYAQPLETAALAALLRTLSPRAAARLRKAYIDRGSVPREAALCSRLALDGLVRVAGSAQGIVYEVQLQG